LSWATPLHRLVASVLGLLIVFMAFFSLRNEKQRLISFALLALTVFLAVLGIWSGS
jgi:heme A synthase